MQREEIYQRVWGYAMVHGDRSVDVFVRKLRQKLEKVSPRWRYIHTHFGIGYRFAAEPLDAVDEAPRPRRRGGSGRFGRIVRRGRRRRGRAAERVHASARRLSGARLRHPAAGELSFRLVGPDRNTHLRNFGILILIAIGVWQLPGGDTAADVTSNILGLMFAAGIVFLGYRMYMEHRTSLFCSRTRCARSSTARSCSSPSPSSGPAASGTRAGSACSCGWR